MAKLYFNAERNHVVFDMDSFAKFNKLCVDTVNGQVEGHSIQEANRAIYNKILEVMDLPENPTRQQVNNAMRFTAKREAFFEIISNTVESTLITGWSTTPFFMEFVEVKRGDLGDKNEFYVEDPLNLLVSRVANSNHDMIRQRPGVGRVISPAIHEYGAKVYIEAERYLMGAEDYAKLIAALSRAFTTALNGAIYTAFANASAGLGAQWNKTGQMSTNNHDQFVRLLSDVQIATGAPVQIMGTKIALSGLRNLGDVNWIASDAKNDFYHTGMLGSFEGTRLFEIPQAFAPNDTTSYLVSDTTLWITPIGNGNDAKFVKLFYEGDTQVYDIRDRIVHVDHTLDYEMTMKWGVDVVLAGRIGTWTITQ